MVLIESITTTYKELFTVTISHPSFEVTYDYKEPVTNIDRTITGSSIFNVISVKPDKATEKLFVNYGISYKCTNNVVICFIRSRLQEAYVALPEDVRIRFMIHVQNSFLSETAVEAAGSKKVYNFTNVGRTGNAANRFITKDASGVDSTDLMDIGDIEPEDTCFAVLDVLTSVTDADYRLFNIATLESPGYTINFKNK